MQRHLDFAYEILINLIVQNKGGIIDIPISLFGTSPNSSPHSIGISVI